MSRAEDLGLEPGERQRLDARVGAAGVGGTDGRGLRVGIVAAQFNGAITVRLIEGALGGLEECGVSRHDVSLAWVPGAFEVPLAAAAMLSLPSPPDAVLTLGAVIRGETGHYEVVANECAAGVQRVQLDSGRPVIFGVLTVETVEQALERSAPDDTNKGREAAFAAVAMASLLTGPPFA
jgi:6,7-dimethyl-8-ribityllumazine synthase